MNRLLITLGDSWTMGKGSFYKKGMKMSEEEYKERALDENIQIQNSFGSILARKYNLSYKTFSTGGSSNQRQFRKAEEYFTSDEYKNDRDKYTSIVVLWGITSVLRTEVYNPDKNKYEKVFFSPQLRHPKMNLISVPFHKDYKTTNVFAKQFSQEEEVRRLKIKMLHWNDHFKHLGIKNLWFDTFNHHDYGERIENMCFDEETPRDLLSKLVACKTVDNNYHKSWWKVDTPRIKEGIDVGILNPISYHPTAEGYQLLADMLSPLVERNLH